MTRCSEGRLRTNAAVGATAGPHVQRRGVPAAAGTLPLSRRLRSDL